MKYLIFCFFIYSSSLLAQEMPLSAFDILMDKEWKAEGTWADGSKFYQIKTFEYALDSTIIITKSIGFIDKEQKEIGQRNHGIIRFNSESNEIEFHEFDVFGGLTRGNIKYTDNEFIYIYQYGDYRIIDKWLKVDGKTYKFIVGDFTNNELGQIYLESKFILLD